MADYAVVDPATGETVKEYPTISDAELQDAIARAADAGPGWSLATPLADRVAAIRKVAALHEERKDELAKIIVREMGKPLEQAVGEVEFAAAIYEYYADNAESLLADEPIELLEGDGSAIIRRSAFGLLLGIMPWNFPYYQVARFAGPNLLIGNTILLKHAPQCPESSAAMADIFHEAGVPADVYINVYATNDQIATVIADPRLRGVSLTGSGRAGAAVAELAGKHLKKVVLELGGSDPFIVLSTDDLESVVQSAVDARLDNTGQSCNAAKRFIVIDELYDDFVRILEDKLLAVEPAPGLEDGAAIGPLSSAQAAERLAEQVQEAVAAGAELTGGGRDGTFFKPGILTGIEKGNPAYGEELFGPWRRCTR